MARIKWDSVGSRYFEYGVDRGVLYVGSSNYGVAWNGLVNVNSRTATDSPTSHYIDGLKYYTQPHSQDFSGTIEAYTYPTQFEQCEGIYYNPSGLGFDTQTQSTFGLSYRTMIGNDVDGLNHGYILHVVYNALAAPSSRENATVSETVEPETFTWEFTTTPVVTPGRLPTAHFMLDSTRVKTDTMRAIEDILYGSTGTNPKLLSAVELITMVDDWNAFQIVPTPSGIATLDHSGPDDLSGNLDDGIFTATPDTRLTATTVPGIFRLE